MKKIPFLFLLLISSSFAALTQPEQQEYDMALQKALTDPAVQSTREIARMSIHKAMLKSDPTLETLLADSDTRDPQGMPGISDKKKKLGENFDEWLANYPSAMTDKLAPEQLHQLETAHAKALEDPTVISALKTARLTFYNAMTNADPLIAPILAKNGIQTPKSVQPLSKNATVGSEEKILGGDVQAWGNEILAPAISTQKGN